MDRKKAPPFSAWLVPFHREKVVHSGMQSDSHVTISPQHSHHHGDQQHQATYWEQLSRARSPCRGQVRPISYATTPSPLFGVQACKGLAMNVTAP